MVETENNDDKCPKCRAELHFVDRLGSHYCFDCEMYIDLERTIKSIIDEEVEKVVEELKQCPSCGESSARTPEGRLFCYSCETYMTEPGEQEESTEEELAAMKGITDSVEPVEEPRTEGLSEDEGGEMERSPETLEETAPLEIETHRTLPEKTVVRTEKKGENKADRKICAYCDGELKYVQKYDRWYCYSCRKYAPKTPPRIAARICPECNGEARYVEKYDRWYCQNCRRYLSKEREGGKTPPESRPAKTKIPRCDRCRRPASWIAKYGRYYCHTCKRYLPRTKRDDGAGKEASVEAMHPPSCTICGRPMKYIEKYGRYYCYPCRRYAPITDK